jgi:hypothetical protein
MRFTLDTSVNRIVVLSKRVSCLITRDVIEFHVNYTLWRSIPPLDERGMAIAIAELARRRLVPVAVLARTFGLSRPTVYRWMDKLEGTYVPTDHRPRVESLGDLGLSTRMLAFVRRHLDRSDEELVEMVWEQFHRPIDTFGIARLRESIEERRRHQGRGDPPPSAPVQGQLFGLEQAPDVPSDDDQPPQAPPEEMRLEPCTQPPAPADVDAVVVEPPWATRGPVFTAAAGTTLALPFLARAGLVPALAAQGALDQARPLVGMLGLSLLSFAAPESVKELHREDLRPLVAHRDGLATERELRRAAHDLAPVAAGLVDQVGGTMARVLAAPEEPPIVYIDGHFIPYSGQHRIARGYSTRHRMALPGHMATYLHIRSGGRARPLLFTVASATDPFRPQVLRLTERFKALTGTESVLVFDRGAVGWKMTDALLGAGQAFVCYAPAPSEVAKRAPEDAFVPLELRSQGRTVLCEAASWKEERHGKTLYLHALRMPDGATLYVTTSLSAPPSLVVPILWGRWAIENSFKLYGPLGLNHLGVYAMADPGEGKDLEREVAHPVYGAAKRRQVRVRRELLDLEDAYGTVARRDGTVTGLLKAPASATQRWQRLAAELAEIEAELERTPSRIPLGDLLTQNEREAFDYGPKIALDLMRVIALNAEHALRDEVQAICRNPRHERRIARTLLTAPGTYEATDRGVLEIGLRVPGRRLFAQVARAVLENLNRLHLAHPLAPELTVQWSLRPL